MPSLRRASIPAIEIALAISAAIASSGCDPQRVENFFVGLLLLVFGVFGALASLVGLGFAALHLAQRRPRSAAHVILAMPFAGAAVSLHAAGTFGVDHVRAPGLGWLFWVVGLPLVWLALAIVQTSLAPPAPKKNEAPIEPPPLTAAKVLSVAIPVTLALGLYAALLGRALGRTAW